MTNKKAIVLLSGGLDSAVALYWARAHGYDCSALSFDYGQRHRRELLSARALCAKTRVPHHIVKFKLPWSSSTLTNAKRALPHHSLKEIARHKIPSTYVPGRNTIFLSFALSYADQVNAATLVIGANALDYSGYPDCRPKFLDAFERVAQSGSRLGTEGKIKIRIEAPLLRLTKEQIVRLGKKLNVPLDLTWSCYSGGRRPCGFCDSCLLRDKGFRQAGL